MEGDVKVEVVRKSEFLWEIPPRGGMRVPGRIFASERLMEEIRDDVAAKQVANVAHLPGIVGYSWAMPDVSVPTADTFPAASV